jgi:hypothetical protein
MCWPGLVLPVSEFLDITFKKGILKTVNCQLFNTTEDGCLSFSSQSTSSFSKLMGFTGSRLCQYDYPRHVEKV